MKNNIYEAPKAIVLSVSATDVITTSVPFNSVDHDILDDAWLEMNFVSGAEN